MILLVLEIPTKKLKFCIYLNCNKASGKEEKKKKFVFNCCFIWNFVPGVEGDLNVVDSKVDFVRGVKKGIKIL